jgi:hypothetical protein
MRRCFDDDEDREDDDEIEVDGIGGWPFVVGGDDREGADADNEMISSGESRTAESTSMSTMLCSSGVTSAGFHCSSSTSFAERDNRLWWNACRNALAW